MISQEGRVPSSFRDPSGFVFKRNGVVFRQISKPYVSEWASLTGSGLFEHLWNEGLLVRHEQDSVGLAPEPDAVAVIRPEPIPLISYPWEWSFGMLKAAALATLNVQRAALDKGFVLKDASAFNIQFLRGRPVFIDTLSFERWDSSQPWIAYAQFCRHFLAPLALMAKSDIRLQGLLAAHLDGIPLDLASRLLPGATRLNLGLGAHIHLHAKAKAGGGGGREGAGGFSENAMRGLVQSLASTIEGLDWRPAGTEWADYYNDTNYTPKAAAHKESVVKEWVAALAGTATTCWDLGANDGRFSRIAAQAGLQTASMDMDPAAVELAWRYVAKSGEQRLLPLLADLRNPSPAAGWMNTERDSLLHRGPADLVLALALIHHLAIGGNVPLPSVLECLAACGRTLIVEWVPKDDSQVQRMMAARKDIFAGFTEQAFQAAVPSGMAVQERVPIQESGRVLYRIGPK